MSDSPGLLIGGNDAGLFSMVTSAARSIGSQLGRQICVASWARYSAAARQSSSRVNHIACADQNSN